MTTTCTAARCGCAASSPSSRDAPPSTGPDRAGCGGRRAHLRLAAPVPPPAAALGTPARATPGVHASRLCVHLSALPARLSALAVAALGHDNRAVTEFAQGQYVELYPTIASERGGSIAS